jgi:hypothetical protein
MNLEKDSAIATAPAAEQQPPASPTVVNEPGNASYPDLTSLLAALEHERIATLAYFYWQQRGCPEGSPDHDWLSAEQHIRENR